MNIALICVLMAATMGQAFAKQQKIGIVDMQSIFQRLPQVEKAKEQLQKEFGDEMQKVQKLQGDLKFNLEKLKRDAATMSKKDKTALEKKLEGLQAELQTLGQPLQRRMRERQEQVNRRMQALIVQTVSTVATEQKIDIVMPKQTIIYNNPTHEITEAVFERVSKLK